MLSLQTKQINKKKTGLNKNTQQIEQNKHTNTHNNKNNVNISNLDV